MRKYLDLYANVKLVKTVPSAPKQIDPVILRDNIEGLYIKEERTRETVKGKVAEAVKWTMEKMSLWIARMAGEVAKKRAIDS